MRVIFIHYLINKSLDKESRTLLRRLTHALLTDWVVALRLTRHKNRSFRRRSPSQSLGLVWKKINLTQQKHAFTHQKKCTTTQNKHKKSKARYSRLLRHPAWKRRGSVFIAALHKFVTYLLN